MSNVEQYVALREQGMTYAMIAKKYGVTRQAIQDGISHHKNRITYIKPTTVVFPGLRQWMTEHHIRVAELERMTGIRLRHALSTGHISNQSIELVLASTGLTYEQAFRR